MLNRTALLAPLAALLLAAAPPPPPAAASLDRLTAEHHLALRCGAVFAITASEQARGLPQANKWPALATRGREFFVRSAARIMDETGLAREDVRAAAMQEAQAVQRQTSTAADPEAAFSGQMTACLPLLNALPLPAPTR